MHHIAPKVLAEGLPVCARWHLHAGVCERHTVQDNPPPRVAGDGERDAKLRLWMKALMVQAQSKKDKGGVGWVLSGGQMCTVEPPG